MGNRKDERKGNLLASAILGAAGLALGWAALELGMGGVMKPGRDAIDRSLEPKQYKVVGEEAPGVLVVEEVAEKPQHKTHHQLEEEEIVKILDEGCNRTKRDQERNRARNRS